MLSGSFPFRQFIRASEQSNSAFNIIKILDAKTDPTTGRQIMMRLRETRGDQLVPNTLRKWYIYKIVTVNVTDLSPPKRYSVPPKRCRLAVTPGQLIALLWICSLAFTGALLFLTQNSLLSKKRSTQALSELRPFPISCRVSDLSTFPWRRGAGSCCAFAGFDD
jgi:hypothetical protein